MSAFDRAGEALAESEPLAATFGDKTAFGRAVAALRAMYDEHDRYRTDAIEHIEEVQTRYQLALIASGATRLLPRNEARAALADEISGIQVGTGYESTTIGITAALEAADALLNAFPNLAALLDTEPSR